METTGFFRLSGICDDDSNIDVIEVGFSGSRVAFTVFSDWHCSVGPIDEVVVFSAGVVEGRF